MDLFQLEIGYQQSNLQRPVLGVAVSNYVFGMAGFNKTLADGYIGIVTSASSGPQVDLRRMVGGAG